MKNIKINKFNLNLLVSVDETKNNVITSVALESGSVLNTLKSTAKSRLIFERTVHAGDIDANNVVINDITFKKLTSALSFAFGYQASSKQYLAVFVEINNALSALGLATTQPGATTQTSAQAPTRAATTKQATTQKRDTKLRNQVNYYDLLKTLETTQANYQDSFLKMSYKELGDAKNVHEFISCDINNNEYANANVLTCNYVSASDTEILSDDLESDYQKLDDLQIKLGLLLSDNNIALEIDGTKLLTERTFNEYIFAPTLEDGAKVFTKIAKCCKAPDELIQDIYNKLTTKEAEEIFKGIQEIKKD